MNREKQIEEILKVIHSNIYLTHSDVAIALYEAGFRKMDEITLKFDLGDRSAEEIEQIAEMFNGEIKKQVARDIIQIMKQVQAMFYDKEYVAIQNLIAKKYGVEIDE